MIARRAKTQTTIRPGQSKASPRKQIARASCGARTRRQLLPWTLDFRLPGAFAASFRRHRIRTTQPSNSLGQRDPSPTATDRRVALLWREDHTSSNTDPLLDHHLGDLPSTPCVNRRRNPAPLQSTDQEDDQRAHLGMDHETNAPTTILPRGDSRSQRDQEQHIGVSTASSENS